MSKDVRKILEINEAAPARKRVPPPKPKSRKRGLEKTLEKLGIDMSTLPKVMRQVPPVSKQGEAKDVRWVKLPASTALLRQDGWSPKVWVKVPRGAALETDGEAFEREREELEEMEALRSIPVLPPLSRKDYHSFLDAPDWTFEETETLIHYADRYGFCWTVIADHWPFRERSEIELEERFFTTAAVLFNLATHASSTATPEQVARLQAFLEDSLAPRKGARARKAVGSSVPVERLRTVRGDLVKATKREAMLANIIAKNSQVRIALARRAGSTASAEDILKAPMDEKERAALVDMYLPAPFRPLGFTSPGAGATLKRGKDPFSDMMKPPKGRDTAKRDGISFRAEDLADPLFRQLALFGGPDEAARFGTRAEKEEDLLQLTPVDFPRTVLHEDCEWAVEPIRTAGLGAPLAHQGALAPVRGTEARLLPPAQLSMLLGGSRDLHSEPGGEEPDAAAPPRRDVMEDAGFIPGGFVLAPDATGDDYYPPPKSISLRAAVETSARLAATQRHFSKPQMARAREGALLARSANYDHKIARGQVSILPPAIVKGIAAAPSQKLFESLMACESNFIGVQAFLKHEVLARKICRILELEMELEELEGGPDRPLRARRKRRT